MVLANLDKYREDLFAVLVVTAKDGECKLKQSEQLGKLSLLLTTP